MLSCQSARPAHAFAYRDNTQAVVIHTAAPDAGHSRLVDAEPGPARAVDWAANTRDAIIERLRHPGQQSLPTWRKPVEGPDEVDATELLCDEEMPLPDLVGPEPTAKRQRHSEEAFSPCSNGAASAVPARAGPYTVPARKAGQRRPPVHFGPFRLTEGARSTFQLTRNGQLAAHLNRDTGNALWALMHTQWSLLSGAIIENARPPRLGNRASVPLPRLASGFNRMNCGLAIGCLVEANAYWLEVRP